MTNPVGITRQKFLSASNLSDGVLHDVNLKGGFQSFKTIADRNAIPTFANSNTSEYDGFGQSDDVWSSGRRRVGMLIYVIEENKFYQLIPVGYFGNGGNAEVTTPWETLPQWEKALRIDPTGSYSSGPAGPPTFNNAPQSTATDLGIAADADSCWVEVGLEGPAGADAPVKVFEFHAPVSTHYKVGGDGEYEDPANNINPTLYVCKGETYTFKRMDPNHPLRIKNQNGDIQAGVIQGFNFPIEQGNDLVWKIPQDAFGIYTYECDVHPGMTGQIVVCCVDGTPTPTPTPTGTTLDDGYTPVDGVNFRFLARKTIAPYFGIFDDQFNEVNTGYNFSSLPNYSSYKIRTISDNFTYMIAAGNGTKETVLLSTNNGESWSSLGFSAYSTDCFMSKSGQVMVIGSSNNTLEVSVDYGINFTTHNLNNIITSGTNIILFSKIALSASGKYILVAVKVSGTPSDENDYRCLISTDYGATFNDVTSTVGFPNLKTNNNRVDIQDVLVSGDGKYQIYFQGWSDSSAYGYSRYSDDYGVTFSDKAYQRVDYNEQGSMSTTGQYFILGTGTQTYFSDDYGASTPLKTINNFGGYYFGVSNSGKYSLTSSFNSSTVNYSDDFFSTFTSISIPSGVLNPYVIIDMS